MPNLDRISVSTWSFHALFEAPRQPLEALDFPQMIADRYHVHNVEIVFPHLSSTDSAYLNEFKNRLKKAHSRIVHIPIDYKELWEQPALSSPDINEREHAISLYKSGIDVASSLGCPAVRCDPGRVNLENPAITIDSYRALVAYAASKSVEIIVENHGSISQHPEVLVTILEASGAGALPDIGNWPDDATRERGLRLLYPLAKGISHAKLDTRFDLGKYLRIAAEAGYQGLFSVEATTGDDPYEAVRQIAEALQQTL